MVEKFWFDRAREALEAAERLHREGFHWAACFLAHQAAEYALKGVLVKYTGQYPYTHDLGELLELVEARLGVDLRELYEAADFLTPHYVASRYSSHATYNARRSGECVGAARRIVDALARLGLAD